MRMRRQISKAVFKPPLRKSSSYATAVYRMGGQLWRLLKSSQQMKRLQSYLSGLMTTCVVVMKE